MNKHTFGNWIPFLLFLILGLGCWFVPVRFADIVVAGAGVTALLSAFPFLFHAFSRKRPLDGAAGVVCIAFGLVCMTHAERGMELVARIYEVYITLIGLVLMLQWVLDRFHDRKGLLGLVYTVCGVALLLFHRTDGRFVLFVLGAYCLLQALQEAFEQLYFSSRYDALWWSFKYWSCLPACIAAILPSFVMGWLQDRKLKGDHTDFDAVKNDLPVNLRVWIHTGTYGARLYGHMTFSRNDIMYSYGDYDVPAEKLFGTIGPGIFFTVNAENYANNCCIVEHSPLFEYGIHLTPAQEEKFAKMSDEIFAQTVPWQCPMQAAMAQGKKVSLAQYGKMYANRLWYRTHCAFRRYTSGPWKWYALLGNNCSNFAAAKLNEIGLHLPVSHGIVSPGEFYVVMETAFRDPDSNVVSRSWHSAEVPSTLFPPYSTR